MLQDKSGVEIIESAYWTDYVAGVNQWLSGYRQASFPNWIHTGTSVSTDAQASRVVIHVDLVIDGEPVVVEWFEDPDEVSGLEWLTLYLDELIGSDLRAREGARRLYQAGNLPS